MADWMGKLKLDCPMCGAELDGVIFKVEFIFVDGQRHRTGEVWELSCRCTLQEPYIVWDTDEDSDGMTWSALLDSESGEPLLVWKDGLSEAPSGCDCGECAEDEHDIDL